MQRNKDLQMLQQDLLNLQHKYFLRKGLVNCNKNNDSYTRNSVLSHQDMKETDHTLYMDNIFSSLYELDKLHTRTINCCGTLRQDHYGMLVDSNTKTLKRGDTRAGVTGFLAAITWKAKEM